MVRHSRWVVATAAALTAVLMTAPAGSARVRRHVHASPSAPAEPPAVTPAAPPREPTAAAQSTSGKAGTGSVTLDDHDAVAILGKDVRSSADEDMGRLVDVVVDHDGQPRAAIIDFGGFLGVGSRKIAVDWGALNFARGAAKGVITVELTRDQVKAAPEFKEGKPVVILGAIGNEPPEPPPAQDKK